MISSPRFALACALLAGCGSDPASPDDAGPTPVDASDVVADATDLGAADVVPEVAPDAPADTTEPDVPADAESDPDGMPDATADASDVDAGSDADVTTDLLPPGCGDIPTFDAGRVPSRALHVSEGGSDSEGDGTADAPFGSIPRAAEEATPGTMILVHSGTYRGSIFLDNLQGEADAPIWLSGAPGEERPVIDAAGEAEALHLIRPQYLIVENLVLRNAAGNGLNADDGGDYDDPEAAHHVIFRNLLIEDIGPTGNRDCLKLSGLRDHFVLNSTFRRCGDGGSAVDQVGCHEGVIARNTFEDLGSSGVQSKGGTADIDIYWNTFSRAGARPVNMGGSTGLEFFRPPVDPDAPNAEATRIRVMANRIIGGETAAAFVGCVDCVFSHNTVLDPSAWPLRILQEQTSGPDGEFLAVQNGVVENNIFVFERAQIRSFVNVGPDTLPETFTFRNNLWFARDDPGRSTPDLPSATSGDVVGEDPELDGDLHIDSDSPAARAGFLSDVPGDFDGRCYRNPPSIGAWEPSE